LIFNYQRLLLLTLGLEPKQRLKIFKWSLCNARLLCAALNGTCIPIHIILQASDMLRVIQLNTLEDRSVSEKQQWDSAVKFLEKSVKEKLQVQSALQDNCQHFVNLYVTGADI